MAYAEAANELAESADLPSLLSHLKSALEYPAVQVQPLLIDELTALSEAIVRALVDRRRRSSTFGWAPTDHPEAF